MRSPARWAGSRDEPPDRSGPAERALEEARELAAAHGHGIVGIEHLLLALVQGDEGSFARRLLDEIGVTEPIGRRIEAAIGGSGGAELNGVVVVRPGEGHRVGNVEFLARSADTQRFNFALIEIQPHRDGPPEHLHEAEDDAFYILEGELTFGVEGEEVVAGPGTFVLVLPGLRHTFTPPPASTSGWRRTKDCLQAIRDSRA